MGVLECHELIPPDKMMELHPQAVHEKLVEFMIKVQIRIFLMDKVEVQVIILLRDN